MALSEDQKAMLRLLSQRGEQGYEDLSALLEIGPDEVYAKAQEAAAELEAEGIPAPSIPAPPQGTGSEPSRAEKPAPPKPESAESAPPTPSRPEPAAPKPTPEAPASIATTPPRSGFELPSGKGARAAVAASALVVLAIVVILLLSSGDGSGDSGSGTSGETQTPSSETASDAANANPSLTQAVLSPVDGGDAEGRAIFGRIKKNVILQVQAEGLEPSPKGSSYTIWLYKSPKLVLRVGSVNVAESGGIAAQFPIPTELLAYVAGGAFNQVDVSLTEDAAYQAEIAKAKKQERLPAYTGEDVLRGPITGPAIKAAREAGGE